MFKIILILFLLNINLAFSQETRMDIFNPLKQTPSAILLDNITKPTVFNKSNNLLRKPGSFKQAKGEPLYIKGKVIDAFGVPISNALIKIWQTNSAGYYQSIIGKNNKYYDEQFLTSGQSNTDNLGNYEFVTIFPGFYDDRAPHINMIIIHEKFGIIETEFYFKNHKLNKTDPVYNAYPDEDKNALTADVYYVDDEDPSKGKIAEFNIVIDGIHEYKRY